MTQCDGKHLVFTAVHFAFLTTQRLRGKTFSSTGIRQTHATVVRGGHGEYVLCFVLVR